MSREEAEASAAALRALQAGPAGERADHMQPICGGAEHRLLKRRVGGSCTNSVTGQRKAFWLGGGYCPLVQGWLRAGDIVVGPHGTTIIGNR
jgi:hypothetical protein